MPDGVSGFVPGGAASARHMELNLGNVFAVGFLSLLFFGFTDWTTAYLARKEIPVLSQVSVGAQLYLHGATNAPMT